MKFNLPEQAVIKALIESYIRSRKSKWGLTDEVLSVDYEKSGKINFTKSNTANEKLNGCANILKITQEAGTFATIQAWANAIYLIAEEERLEKERYSGFINKVTQHYGLSTMGLAANMHAIRTYIISKISEDEKSFGLIKNQLQQNIENLVKLIKDLENNHHSVEAIDDKKQQLQLLEKRVEALEAAKDYAEQYYKDVILNHELLACQLGEESFQSFIDNATSGTREYPYCEKILSIVSTPPNCPSEAFAAKSSQPFFLKMAKPITTSEKSEPNQSIYNLRPRC